MKCVLSKQHHHHQVELEMAATLVSGINSETKIFEFVRHTTGLSGPCNANETRGE